MNYELVKQLANAGFPKADMLWGVEGAYTAPSLSELIAACRGTTIKLWISVHGLSAVQREMQSMDDMEWYSTPEEAVARLYLALHGTTN